MQFIAVFTSTSCILSNKNITDVAFTCVSSICLLKESPGVRVSPKYEKWLTNLSGFSYTDRS